MAKILIIDDDTQIVTMLTRYLEYSGHLVFNACNGKDGLRATADNIFDIIITDILMPECDGIELLSSIYNMKNRPKVIAMSGGSPHLDQEHLLSIAKIMKADIVLTKPIQLQNLSEKIEALLDIP